MHTLVHHWKCPQCSATLLLQEKTWVCENAHSFDSAKEGYVNLLLPQHKNSKAPGDNKEMVLARRAFLEQGHYQPLADELARTMIAQSAPVLADETLYLFDAGCGEGFYLNSLLPALNKTFTTINIAGIDISKPAVQKAAKKNKLGYFAVASSYNLPLHSASQHIVLQIFAPSSSQEVHRTLQTNGIWVQVNPAQEHLLALKQMIYDTPEHHKVNTETDNGFSLLSQHQIKFTIALSDPETRQALLMMTPYYWTISQEKKDRLISSLTEVQAHFDIKVLQKRV